ncbi:MAG: hypothetical protein IPK82_11270 [Polyangiaceae bacterium]|nr:hypothetical protein [Polyangiaceae bacterium]
MSTYLLGLAALLFFLAGCGSSGSGEAPKPTSSAKAVAEPGKNGDKPAAVPQNPEDNYVAAATKLGCLGLGAEDPDRLATDKAAVLKEHGYTDDTWKEASKKLGTSKGDAIVKAMESKCPE